MKSIFRNLLLLIFFEVLTLSPFSKMEAQNPPKCVVDIVESRLKKDTLNKKMEEINKKDYILDKIESIQYKSVPTTVYLFGYANPHGEDFRLLFISEFDNRVYSIIGDEGDFYLSMDNLNKIISETTKISVEAIKKCYAYIINSYRPLSQLETSPR